MKIYACLPFLISWFLISPIQGEPIQSERAMIDRLADIQQALFNDRFETAMSLCSLVIEENPDHPAGYSFMTATMMAQMTDREEDLFGERFEQLVDTTITISKKALEHQTPQAQAWTSLWMGNAYAYQALYYARFGSTYNAIKTGLKARDAFQHGRDLDSTNNDLLVGLGSYHYWKSAKAGFLRWLGIFKNEKEKGILELKLAYDSASLYSEAARRAMIWIWLNEEIYDSVIVAATELRERYPEGKAVLWPMAEALTKMKQYEKAAEIYQNLREQLALKPGNYFNLIECDYLLCSVYRKLSQDDRAGEVAAYLDEYYGLIPKNIRKRQKKRLSFLKRRDR